MSNLLDQFVSFVNPVAGAKRARARFLEGMFTEKARKYEAAAPGRRTSDWKTTSASANTEVAMASVTLRNRSRDLCRNNPHAKKAITTLVTNVVGSGIKPSIQIAGNRYAKNIKAAWKAWAESTKCDFEGRKTFSGIQAMCARAVFESGECFVRQHIDKKNAPIPLRLQVLEADFLDITKDGLTTEGDGYIMQGIEFDSVGRRVAYWMYQVHPGENRLYRSMTSKRIPADEILHVYYAERPGQIRGVPVGTSAMLRLKSLDEYDDAELMRKKVAACFGAFVTDSADPLPGETNELGGYPVERLEPGMIEYLKPGKEVTFGNPPPSDGYAEYSTTFLRSIAAGFGVTYEAMTGDLSGVNFSSGRMGWIEMGNIVAEYQEFMMIPVLCSGVWDWFVQMATIMGIGKMDAAATWTTPRRPMLDPVKETKGLSEMVRNGFKSWQDAVREQGDDPDVMSDELAADYAMFEKLGFMLACDPRFDANRVKPDGGEPPGSKKAKPKM